MEKKIIQVEDKVPFRLLVPLSIQHMFAMFGASVLVPFIFGINPAIVLFTNGVGTLLFILITKGKAPAYLGSSFAFLLRPGSLFQNGVILMRWAVSSLSVCVDVFWLLLSISLVQNGLILSCLRQQWDRGCPDWTGIGSSAASTAGILKTTSYTLDEATGLYSQTVTPVAMNAFLVFLITLCVAVFGNVLFKKFLSVIPVLIAIIAGYVSAVFLGVIRMDTIREAISSPLISIPEFQLPHFQLDAILIILPVILVIASEHIGHQVVTSKIVDP